MMPRDALLSQPGVLVGVLPTVNLSVEIDFVGDPLGPPLPLEKHNNMATRGLVGAIIWTPIISEEGPSFGPSLSVTRGLGGAIIWAPIISDEGFRRGHHLAPPNRVKCNPYVEMLYIYVRKDISRCVRFATRNMPNILFAISVFNSCVLKYT